MFQNNRIAVFVDCIGICLLWMPDTRREISYVQSGFLWGAFLSKWPEGDGRIKKKNGIKIHIIRGRVWTNSDCPVFLFSSCHSSLSFSSGFHFSTFCLLPGNVYATEDIQFSAVMKLVYRQTRAALYGFLWFCTEALFTSSRGEFEMCISDKFNSEGLGCLHVFGRIGNTEYLFLMMRCATVIRASLEIHGAVR